MGIIVNHYKDPYQTASIVESKEVFSWLIWWHMVAMVSVNPQVSQDLRAFWFVMLWHFFSKTCFNPLRIHVDCKETRCFNVTYYCLAKTISHYHLFGELFSRYEAGLLLEQKRQGRETFHHALCSWICPYAFRWDRWIPIPKPFRSWYLRMRWAGSLDVENNIWKMMTRWM